LTELSFGGLAMGSAVAAMFFLRFWRETDDRLFLYFTVAFVLLGVHWIGLGLVSVEDETRHRVFLLRLAAFTVLAIGILDKNRRGRSARI
jgi:hypothetical protein